MKEMMPTEPIVAEEALLSELYNEIEIKKVNPDALPDLDPSIEEALKSRMFIDELLSRGNDISKEDSQQIMNHTSGIFKNTIFPKLYFDLPWPKGLYVPEDLKNSLIPIFRPAPPANLFALEWSNPGAPFASSSKATGNMRSFCRKGASTGTIIADACLGIRYSPTNILSTVDFIPEVQSLGSYTYKMDFKEANHPLAIAHFIISGIVMVAAWEENIVNGSFELIPSSVKYYKVFESQFTESTPFGSGSSSRNSEGSLPVPTILVERNHHYVFGVISRAAITIKITDNSGRPYPRMDLLDIDVFADMASTCRQMSVNTKTVYQKGISLEDILTTEIKLSR
jgi:hypothetical protein